ncbi:hypothetical protein RT41_GL001887 [Lactococcus fujiensis JCM 16395]|uniref:Uncharacterized protein n=1 Tax=Lactococcus fujiensis JCM 16395 TaxID=1291764 RepID=A0A2A5RJY7_9LACT|nr:hypothetical protein RT41_GL001887 [Lactococcus fujiensis JCM 16395]
MTKYPLIKPKKFKKRLTKLRKPLKMEKKWLINKKKLMMRTTKLQH